MSHVPPSPAKNKEEEWRKSEYAVHLSAGIEPWVSPMLGNCTIITDLSHAGQLRNHHIFEITILKEFLSQGLSLASQMI